MQPCSDDLRQRIVQACNAGLAHRAVARRFLVRLSFVEKLLPRRRTTGTIAARPHTEGRLRAPRRRTRPAREPGRGGRRGAAKARPHEALDDAVTAALAAITPDDARGWFRHCGYPVG
ncbi:MAG TPA: hypothetical protein VF406_19470 [Thermodesulfobacteriota bacterium]